MERLFYSRPFGLPSKMGKVGDGGKNGGWFAACVMPLLYLRRHAAVVPGTAPVGQHASPHRFLQRFYVLVHRSVSLKYNTMLTDEFSYS